jgi:hypothetical protein
MIDENRGKDGRFLRGHQLQNSRDAITGRFIAKSKETATVEDKVDKLLAKMETEND